MCIPRYFLIVPALILLTTSSCKEKEPIDEPIPTLVPATYNFSNVSYDGQTERLDQLEEMTAYLKTGNQQGVQLSVQVMKEMFANTNGNANGNFSFSSTKQIRDKTFEPHVPNFEDYFNRIAAASLSTETAQNGVAGVMFSADGSQSRLYDENGVELVQLIEKGLMGALCYFQATSVYFSADKMNVDNSEVIPGEGTAMQHHWDEAYGYLGVTNDFPEDVENTRFFGKYCVARNDLLGTNETLSEAFRRGRAAINLDRLDERDQAIEDVRAAWEDVCAATAIHYINEALANMGDDYVRNHVLSEAHAFALSLFYNPERRITLEQIDQVIDLLGENFYEANATNWQNARDLLAGIYGWENIKTAL